MPLNFTIKAALYHIPARIMEIKEELVLRLWYQFVESL